MARSSRSLRFRATFARFIATAFCSCLQRRQRAGFSTEARERTDQARFHQAHRHGAARHCLRKRLLRGRRPLRHPRAAGELEGHSRSPDHRRARRRAHACGPAARRDDRFRHESRCRERVQHGPERQCHHGLERSVGAHEELAEDGCAGQARASHQGRRAQTGTREVQGRRQAVQDGDGLPGLDAQLRAALLARGERHQPGLLFTQRRHRPDPGRCADLRDSAAADAGDARSGNDQRLLRRRAVESAGHRQRRRRAGDHRLRDLEEQSGEGVRRHEGVGSEEPEHASRRS